MILSHEEGHWQPATGPGSVMQSQKQTIDTLTTVLFLTFGTVFNKLHEIFNIYLNIGFLIGDIAQCKIM